MVVKPWGGSLACLALRASKSNLTILVRSGVSKLIYKLIGYDNFLQVVRYVLAKQERSYFDYYKILW